MLSCNRNTSSHVVHRLSWSCWYPLPQLQTYCLYWTWSDQTCISRRKPNIFPPPDKFFPFHLLDATERSETSRFTCNYTRLAALLFAEAHKLLVERSTYLICMYVHTVYIPLKIIHSFKVLFLFIKLALMCTDCYRHLLCTVSLGVCLSNLLPGHLVLSVNNMAPFVKPFYDSLFI